MSAPLVLVSHALCPYVQRAAIVLTEKGVPFERRDIDLANKPAWFLKVSPLGKTPVRLTASTEAQVVDAFYVKDMFGLKLHQKNRQDALEKKLRQAIVEGAERAQA